MVDLWRWIPILVGLSWSAVRHGVACDARCRWRKTPCCPWSYTTSAQISRPPWPRRTRSTRSGNSCWETPFEDGSNGSGSSFGWETPFEDGSNGSGSSFGWETPFEDGSNGFIMIYPHISSIMLFFPGRNWHDFGAHFQLRLGRDQAGVFFIIL